MCGPERRGQRWASFIFDLYLVGCNFLLALPGHAFRHWVLRRLVQAEVGADAAIQRKVRIRSHGGITIGSNTNINSGVLLDGSGGLEIGSRVNVSPEVLLLTSEHDPASPEFAGRTRKVIVEDRAWIASRAIILPGATVCEGAVVAAGAVVRGTVGAWTIVAGNPARQIGERPAGSQEQLAVYRRWLH
jgi:acetyltransferase-like isoleucine patch superfamily enzyme